MTVQTIGTLFVLGALCLPLNLSHQTQVTNRMPGSPYHSPVVTTPHTSERILVGEYTIGNGFGGKYLDLNPDYRFSYRLQSCIGIANKNQGTWQLQNGVIVLYPEDRISIGYESLNLRFIPVTYEKKLYLVDENEMPSFCHDLFTKASSEIGGHYGKKSPLDSGVDIKVLERFRDLIERGQITVRIASVDKSGIAILEGAAVSRLRPGMHLCWKQEEGGWKRELRVLDVGQRSARARQISLHEKHEDKVRPYDLFTTGVGYMSPACTGQTAE